MSERGRRLSGSRRMLALVAVVVMTAGVLAAVATPPAQAAVRNPIPANQFGDPTLNFTDADAIFAYFTSDLGGGRICVIPEGGGGSGCGDEGRVIGATIGTGYTLIEAAPRNGRFQLQTTDSVDNPIATSQAFTVTPCHDCSRVPRATVLSATKAAAAAMAVRFEGHEATISLLEEAADGAIGMRGFSFNAQDAAEGAFPPLARIFTIVPFPGGGLVIQDPATGNINEGLDLLAFVNRGAALMFRGIASDPPDPDFDEVAPPVFATMPMASGVEIQNLIVASDAQRAYGRATLHALERFQGAQAAANLEAQIRQLDALDEYATALADSIDDTADLLRVWADVAAADPELSLPAVTAAEKADLIPIYERVRSEGFTPDEVAQFVALGYTAEDIENIRAHFDADIGSVVPDQPYPDHLREVADAIEIQSDTFRELAREAHVVAARIELDLPPEVPTAVRDQTQTPEDTAVSLNLLANDTHPAGDTLTLVEFTPGSHGSVTCDSLGDCTYIPLPDFWGGDSFTYVVADEAGNTATGVASISVTDVNDPPLAVADTASVAAGTSVLLDVLINDIAEPRGESEDLSVESIVTPATLGQATIEDGKVRYAAEATPGSDSFSYEVCDNGRTSGVGIDPMCAVGDVTITIVPSSPPNAVFASNPAEGLVPLAVDFDAGGSTDSDGTIELYDWDFGDGATASGALVSHTYEAAGTYTVTLTVTDNDGFTDSASSAIDVGPQELEVSFGFNSYRAPLGVERSYEVTTRRKNSDEPVTVEWDFGDGSPVITEVGTDGGFTRFTALHTYTVEGMYELVVTVSDTLGTTTLSHEVTAANAVADAGPDLTAYEGGTISVGGPGTTPSDRFTTVSWDFGDGGSGSSTPVGSHTYVDEGTFTATVTVTDETGSVSDSAIVEVVNVAPEASAAASLAVVGSPTSLRVFAADPGVDDALTYSWDFGDGTAASGSIANHTYPAVGDYQAAVTVDDGDGGTVTRSVDVHVVDAVGASTSAGRDFWLGFSKAAFAQDPHLETLQTLMIVSERTTGGTVSIPGLLWEADFTTTPGRATVVSLPPEVEAEEFSSALPLAVHVSARDDVTVYGLTLADASSDAHLAYPTAGLGVEYLIVTHGRETSNEALIVSTESDTQVTITPTTRLNGDHPLVDPNLTAPFTVHLDLGEVYQIRANTPDMTGSVVESNKPVAVFVGHPCAFIGTGPCDHLDEQLSPTRAWGQHFVTVPLAGRLKGDLFRIVAAEPDTQVLIDGSVVATIGRSEFHEMFLEDPAEITSTKPIQIMQFSMDTFFDFAEHADPFAMAVPPIEQYLPAYTVATPALGFVDNYLNLAAPTGAAVTLDGTPIPSDSFTPIGTSGMSAAQVPVSTGDHRVESTLPLGVWVYGFDRHDSYGYIGGGNQAQIASVAALALEPAAQTLPIGSQACVQASVEDGGGVRLAGIRVDFIVAGANVANGFAFADPGGVAEFCYVASAAGDDTVQAAVGVRTTSAGVVWEESQVNSPPDAIDDLFEGAEDATITVAAPGMLGNDADLDGDVLSVASNTDPSNGSLVINADGSFDYAPADGFCGTDSFTYVASDGEALSDSATVTVDVACVAPRALKTKALQMLQDVLPTGDDKADKKIENAIEHIEKSLTDEWWVDDTTLHDKDGKKVFDEERKAVHDLTKKEVVDHPVAEAVVQMLLDIDETLALLAIDAAVEANADPDRIEKARKEMAKAEEELAKGHFDHAIGRYKKAWYHAQKALR